MEAFKADIQNSDLIRYPKTNATELAQQYDSVLYSLIKLLAPLVTKMISIKPPSPWMTPSILASKRYCRYLERIWRSNPAALNRSRLTRQTHLYNRQVSKAKSAYYSKIIAEHSGDYGSMKLNPGKTEFLLIGNERQRNKYLSMFPIEFLDVKTNPAKSARNLGVTFDQNFTFRPHISAVCSSCFYHMWDLRRIRRHLDLDSAKFLATALVSTLLDYCNSLLYGIADVDLTRLHACTESTGPPGDKVSSIYLQYSTASFPSMVASKV